MADDQSSGRYFEIHLGVLPWLAPFESGSQREFIDMGKNALGRILIDRKIPVGFRACSEQWTRSPRSHERIQRLSGHW